MHRKPSSFVLSVLRHGYLRPLSPVPSRYCHTPLPVAAKGKFRLVLALRQVNAYLNVNTFRCKDLKIVAELFERNDILSRSISHGGIITSIYTRIIIYIWVFSGKFTAHETQQKLHIQRIVGCTFRISKLWKIVTQFNMDNFRANRLLTIGVL